MIILGYILSGLSLLMSILLLIKTKNPLGWITLVPKLTANALSPYWAIMGAAGAVIGWVYQALWAVPMGLIGAGMMIWYVWQCTRDHTGFEDAFGADWAEQIPQEQASQMVKRRWIFCCIKGLGNLQPFTIQLRLFSAMPTVLQN